jgi:hypothetical protein
LLLLLQSSPLPVTVAATIVSSAAPFSWLLFVVAIVTAARPLPPPTFALCCKCATQAYASAACP